MTMHKLPLVGVRPQQHTAVEPITRLVVALPKLFLLAAIIGPTSTSSTSASLQTSTTSSSTTSTSQTSSLTSSASSGLSIGAEAGIGIGAALGTSAVILLPLWAMRRYMRSKHEDPGDDDLLQHWDDSANGIRLAGVVEPGKRNGLLYKLEGFRDVLELA